MAKASNPFEHSHDHGHDDHDHRHDHALPAADLDPAQQSLADALRVSFNLLKAVMLVLVVLYLLSGIVWGVPDQKQAVRLRFGKIVGETREQQVLKPGQVYFAWPFPIEQVVQVPTNTQTLVLDRDFWFEMPPNAAGQTLDQMQGGPLNPEKDGSLLTGDGNIFHARWTVQYQIADPIEFITNIAVPSSDDAVVLGAAQRLVRAAAEEAIVHAAAQASVEDITRGTTQSEQNLVRRDMTDILTKLKSGIQVSNVVITERTFPLAVRSAFNEVASAAATRGQRLDEANQQADRILTETAGAAVRPVMQLINDYELARTAGDTARIADLDTRLDWIFNNLQAPRWAALKGEPGQQAWALLRQLDTARRAGNEGVAADLQIKLSAILDAAEVPLEERGLTSLGGNVAQLMNQATAYRSQVVARLQSEALAFNPGAINPGFTGQGLLAQYRQNPQVFLNRRWQDMIEQVLAADIESFYLPPGQTWLDINRDPGLRQRREEAAIRAEQGQR